MPPNVEIIQSYTVLETFFIANPNHRLKRRYHFRNFIVFVPPPHFLLKVPTRSLPIHLPPTKDRLLI